MEKSERSRNFSLPKTQQLKKTTFPFLDVVDEVVNRDQVVPGDQDPGSEDTMYAVDLGLAHAMIFILPCVILSLFKIWTKLVMKSQAEIITTKLNEELVKLV